jgi:hypothetical protein
MIDELSLGLAPVVVQQLLETLMMLKKTGIAILFVEQNVNLAVAFSTIDTSSPKGGHSPKARRLRPRRRPRSARRSWVCSVSRIAMRHAFHESW